MTSTLVRDSRTMLRRNLLHARRYPSLTLLLLGQPVLFLLLFVYVFGGTMGAGLPGVPVGGGREAYLAYLVPGILIMTVASVALGTAIAVATDMTGGILARFRTMDVAPTAVLTGHVVGALLRTGFALAVVVALAVLLGYRPAAGVSGWLAVVGLLGLLGLALTWVTVGLGLAADSVETASNTPMFLVLLPFVSSGFVPTDAMPAGLRQVAEHQPFTPVIETLRALTTGTPVGGDAAWAVGWCVLIALLGYGWSRRLFTRVPSA